MKIIVGLIIYSNIFGPFLLTASICQAYLVFLFLSRLFAQPRVYPMGCSPSYYLPALPP